MMTPISSHLCDPTGEGKVRRTPMSPSRARWCTTLEVSPRAEDLNWEAINWRFSVVELRSYLTKVSSRWVSAALSEFLVTGDDEIVDLLVDTVKCLVDEFEIPRAEAVARVNHYWLPRQVLLDDGIVTHREGNYWARFIYYEEDTPFWKSEVDRSTWVPRPPPPADSPAWTISDQ
jgi:hypothetical protein